MRFADIPLRVKMALLLALASLLPLAVSTWLSMNEMRAGRMAAREGALAARAEQLVSRLELLNAGELRDAGELARLQPVQALLGGAAPDRARHTAEVLQLLQIWSDDDKRLRGLAVLDAAGRVVVATESWLPADHFAARGFVAEALRGQPVIGDPFVDDTPDGELATVAYLQPVRASGGEVRGLVMVLLRASALWEILRSSHGLGGPASYAALFDRYGTRIAHSFLDGLLYKPAAPLDAATVEQLVAERRFGARTRELLADVRELKGPVQLGLDPPPREMFRAFGPANQQWNLIVGRPVAGSTWSVYYLQPSAEVDASISAMLRERAAYGGLIMLLAAALGALFAAAIVRPVRALNGAAQALMAGDTAARAAVSGRDELGQLGSTFNAMAARLAAQAEALQQESEARYRALFEAMLEGFCKVQLLYGPDGRPNDYRILEVNPAFERLTGLTNARGRRMREVMTYHEDRWFDMYQEALTTGQPLRFQNEARDLGRYYDVQVFRVGPAADHTVAVVFNDISEQKFAERRIREQLERLQMLQQITHAVGERQDTGSIFQVVVRTLEDRLPADFCCICLYEAEHQRLEVARVGLRSQELALELALGERARFSIDENGLSRCVRGQLVYEPDLRAIPFPFPQRLSGGGLGAMVAAPLQFENEVFGVLIVARRAAESFSSGECEFLHQLCEHVALAAHHSQLYASLEAAYRDLRETQQTAMQQERLRALGQMASGIAHDINNAVSPVALYADSLLEREPGLSPQGRAQLETIQRAIHDVAATVSRMREFYRPRAHQLVLMPVQLNDLVPQVADLTRARWSTIPQQRGVMIEMLLDLAAGLPSVMGVEGEIREALTNLVFNAVDAMPQGGRITMRTRTEGATQVLVEVVDTGVGMDEDARRRCLEPFYTTKGERGTGLGLPMVYGMAQRHSAEVEIDSAPGAGTTVRLRFAAAPEHARAIEADEGPLPTGLRLLVIDDDPVLLRSLCESLAADGHQVQSASGGQEGIDLFRDALETEAPFEAVITDMGMPYVDGRRVAAALKGLAPDTPVIMLTGWGQRLAVDGEALPHVDELLSKPPRLRELRGALARLTRGERR